MSKSDSALKGWTGKMIARFFNPQTGEISSHRLTNDGAEIISATPIAPPVGYRPPQESMFEIVRRQVADEMRRHAAEQADETDEDRLNYADYLVRDEDEDTPLSPHEVDRIGAQLDRELEVQRAARLYAHEQEQAGKKKPPSDAPKGSEDAVGDPPPDGPPPPKGTK